MTYSYVESYEGEHHDKGVKRRREFSTQSDQIYVHSLASYPIGPLHEGFQQMRMYLWSLKDDNVLLYALTT